MSQHNALLIPMAQLTSKSPLLEQGTAAQHLGHDAVHFNDCELAKCLTVSVYITALIQLYG
jgi:hypothetical protein